MIGPKHVFTFVVIVLALVVTASLCGFIVKLFKRRSAPATRIVFVKGSNAVAKACAAKLNRSFNLLAAPTRRWERLLCFLCHGQAYDLIQHAIVTQGFTLLYGYPWSHAACEKEMRIRFPTAIWVDATEDAGEHESLTCVEPDCCFPDSETSDTEALYTPLRSLSAILQRRLKNTDVNLPCSCTQIELVCKNDNSWACDESKKFSATSCFSCIPNSNINPQLAIQLYIDGHCVDARTEDYARNLSWIVEGKEIVPDVYENVIYSCVNKCFRIFVHSSLLTHNNIVGHVPFGGCWVSVEEYTSSKAVRKQLGASFFASNKKWTSGHKFRHDCLNLVRSNPAVKTFGVAAGSRLDRKAVGLLPYMYSIVVENGIEHGYWTEKIVDALACRSVVFYWGAPDISHWFDMGSVRPFHTLQELTELLDTMSEADYYNRLPSVELNWNRIPAYFSSFHLLALCTDTLSSMHGTKTVCLQI